MKNSYIFIISLIISSQSIKPSDQVTSTREQKKTTRIDKLDRTILQLTQDTKKLNDRISFFNNTLTSEDTKKRYDLYNDFVSQLQTYRDAIDQKDKNKMKTAKNNMRSIKNTLTEF